jgi:aminoglycoside 3-N-acetyltransferase
MPDQQYIPYFKIADQFDIQPGDVLLIASDITRLAFYAKRKENKFDINAFIDQFLNKLSSEGTLILPAYNFNLLSGQVFDIRKTIPVTGSFSISAFRRDDFKRTWHPLHSFMVWGKYADELCQLRNISSFGLDSPFAKFLEWRSKMLFIGTNVAEAFTFTHFVEELNKVFYRKYSTVKIHYIYENNSEEELEFMIYRKRFGWTMQLDMLQGLLEKSVLNKKMINGVEFSMLHLEKAFPVIRNDITENKARNIAKFDLKLYFRDLAKNLLHRYNIYKTTQDKIDHAADIY